MTAADSSSEKVSISEFAQKIGRKEEEVKSALLTLKLYKRLSPVTRLDADKRLKVSEYLKKQEKPAAAKPAVKSAPRKVGGTQVTERLSRRKRPVRPLPVLPAADAKADAAVEEKSAPPAAAKKAEAPAAKKKAAAVKDEEAGASLSRTEALYQRQIEKQEEKKEEQIRRQEKEEKKPKTKLDKAKGAPAPASAPAPAPKAGEAKKSGKAGKGKQAKETIRINAGAIDAHRRKRKQTINRTVARKQVAEKQHVFQKPTKPIVREVEIPEVVSVSRLAADMSLKSGVIIRKLMDHGMNVTVNELLDRETAWIIVEELGHRPVEAATNDLEESVLQQGVVDAPLLPRPPVVTVMGHVDHGKTSLLDYIRKTRVAPGEAGGITQNIGAYQVECGIGSVTFIDTPGHALFTQMRARGAEVTDIVVLVVAADDGVKPQTIEAINHAKAAKVPIVVAANKIDKPEADLEKVKRELASQDVLPEDWGGDAIVVPVSAETGAGVDQLLDALATQADILELKAPQEGPAAGVVVEAKVDKGRGIVATVIVSRGTLKRGDSFLCGAESGRIRAMWNAGAPQLEQATPSMPVEIQSLSGVPDSGAELLVVDDERKAREVAASRQDSNRAKGIWRTKTDLAGGDKALLGEKEEVEWKELKIVVKADVEGSREALVAALAAVKGKKAGVKVVHSAVGNVTESDIYLAQTSGDVIVAFNVRPNGKARALAGSRGVKILTGNVIYELMEKVRLSVLDLLDPIVEEKLIGNAEVLRVFNISKTGNIAGCRVTDGVVRANSPVRLVRDGVPVYQGRVSSLHHFKDAAGEIRSGMECGIGIEKFNDIKVGDVIEAIEQNEIPPEM